MTIFSLRRVAVMMVVGGVLGLVEPAVVDGARSGDDGDSSVVLVDAGDQSNAVQLPARAAVGDAATFTSFQSTEVTIAERNGPTNHVDFSLSFAGAQTVMAVATDRGHTERMRIDDAERSPAFERVGGFDPVDLIGLTFTQHVDADGGLGGIEFLDSGRLRESAQLLGQQFSVTSPIAFAGQPVGIGAQWTREVFVPTAFGSIAFDDRFELVELGADRYVVDIAFLVDVDVSPFGAHVSGSIEGDGQFSASLDDALESSISLRQAASLSIVEEQGTADLTSVDASSRDGVAR